LKITKEGIHQHKSGEPSLLLGKYKTTIRYQYRFVRIAEFFKKMGHMRHSQGVETRPLYTSVGKIVKLWRKPHGSSFFSPPF
jgi:hypothetical protein